MSSTNNRTGVFDAGPETMGLDEFVAIAGRQSRIAIRTATVGVLVATAQQPFGYDPSTQKVSVQVQPLGVVKNPSVDQGPGSTVTQAPVVLVDVPVSWARSGDNYFTFPLKVGDSGELIVQDRALDVWMLSGAPADPTINRTHSLADAVFHPGLHADTNPITPPTDMTATVVAGSLVKLGRDATSPAVLGNALISALDAVFAAGVPVPGDGGAAVQTAQQTAWQLLKNTILSTSVLVK
jgi:hypothetical protein